MQTLGLFAYGTLQFPQIIAALLGRELAGVPALLREHSRFRVADRVYPAVVAAPGGEVPGVLYSGLEPADLERLDAYEGPLYERVDVTLQTSELTVAATTYLLRAEHRHRLSAEAWDLGEFQREHLASYLALVSRTARAP